MTVVHDRTFANRGTLWSGMARSYSNSFTTDEATHTVGGYATGVHLLPQGSACLVVGGWTYYPSPVVGAVPAQPGSETKLFTTARLVVFPPDGAPRERLRWDSTRIYDLSEATRMATPVASCSASNGDVAVLIRQVPIPQNAFLPWEYTVSFMNPSGNMTPKQAVLSGWLHDSFELPQPGSVRMAADGADLGIASSGDTRVRITMLRAAGAVPRDIDLAGSPALPGLVRLEVASVRFNAGTASIALTAYLNHPGVGTTSVGAILRVFGDGSRDPGFGDNGLWVSPLMKDYRGFVCAGETAGVLAGCVGRRAVVFGIDPVGSPFGGGLDPSFNLNGIAEQDLGGPLADPVAASDDSGVYVFAQRVPTQIDASGDFRTAGCRFRWAPGSPDHGAADPSWGSAGIVTLRCDGAPFTPVGVVIGGSTLFVAGTRQLRGIDCDRVPVVVTLEAANGDPILSYGAGGFALFGSVRHPATIAPDGATIFVNRSSGSTRPALRFITASGEEGHLATLPPIVAAAASITTLSRLADGSLLVAGGGAEAWVIKLEPTGALDTSFGTGGVLILKPGVQGEAKVLGARANGDIVLRINSLTSELAVVHPSGQLDLTYGSSGFVEVRGFTDPSNDPGDVRCFLDADGSVVCVVSTYRPRGSTAPVRVALRRITSAGGYDPSFGLGLPSVQAPTPGRLHVLVETTNTKDEYTRISPAGIAWLGSRLYVVATGWTGGGVIFNAGLPPIILPIYSLLLIMGWNADGSVDPTFAGIGRQEAGYSPDGKNKFWSASGVLQDSPSSFYVYGAGGEADEVTNTVGTNTYMAWIIRQPQPALYRVEHPTGLDFLFGGDGASTIRLQEFLLTSVAGALLSGGKVRVACVDALTQPVTDQPRVNVGGLVQWRLGKKRPIR